MECEIIRDLLPLYADDVCSESSKRLVEEHIKDCEKCKKELESIQNTEVTRSLREETENIVHREKRRERRASFTVGLVFAAIFALPVLICLIVNLSVGAGLSWFFIVLTSLLVAASVLIVPLMVPKNRFLWTILAFTGTLLLLLLTCALYTKGDWFPVTACAVLFGLSVVFAPIVVNCEPIRTALGKNRFLTVVGVYALTFAAMMLAIGCRTENTAEFWRVTAAVSLPVLVLLLGIALICRFAPVSGRRKTGLSLLWGGVVFFFTESFIGRILGQKVPLPAFRPWDWKSIVGFNGNLCWSVLLTGALLCVILWFTKKKR